MRWVQDQEVLRRCWWGYLRKAAIKEKIVLGVRHPHRQNWKGSRRVSYSFCQWRHQYSRPRWGQREQFRVMSKAICSRMDYLSERLIKVGLGHQVSQKKKVLSGVNGDRCKGKGGGVCQCRRQMRWGMKKSKYITRHPHRQIQKGQKTRRHRQKQHGQ